MTQSYDSRTGAKNLGGTNSNQFPTANTYDTFESASNRRVDQVKRIRFDGAVASSSDLPMTYQAEENGRIIGLEYENGAVAMDGSVGWELQFLNKSNSDDVLAYFGIGSGTEAAKGTDNDTAVAAHGTANIENSDTSRFNKGDLIRCDADRDGTTGVGIFSLVVTLEAEGR